MGREFLNSAGWMRGQGTGQALRLSSFGDGRHTGHNSIGHRGPLDHLTYILILCANVLAMPQ